MNKEHFYLFIILCFNFIFCTTSQKLLTRRKIPVFAMWDPQSTLASEVALASPCTRVWQHYEVRKYVLSKFLKSQTFAGQYLLTMVTSVIRSIGYWLYVFFFNFSALRISKCGVKFRYTIFNFAELNWMVISEYLNIMFLWLKLFMTSLSVYDVTFRT